MSSREAAWVTELKHMIKYLEMLDEVNAKILKAMSVHGPRNISALARATNTPVETVRFRVNEMLHRGLLMVRATVDFSKLGLVQTVTFLEGFPSRERALKEFSEVNPYLTYLVRYYGPKVSYYCMHMVPAGQESNFQACLERAEEFGIIRSYGFLRTGTTYFVLPSFKWFNFSGKTWIFNWDEWVREVEDAPDQPSTVIKDQISYHIVADEKDIRIIEHLQEDALKPFVQISKATGMSTTVVRHHYFKHILGRGLITGYRPIISPFPLSQLVYMPFILKFSDEGSMAKFANTIVDKPFVHSFARVLGKNELRLDTHVPFMEFYNFMNAIISLSNKGLITDYYFAILDLSTFQSWSIRPELFVNGRWTYDHEVYMQRVEEISKRYKTQQFS